ncbi:MAG: hypothetical protein KAT43_04360 [Nanoarchaeota archaeon]|nr:hypothetical protein [Nanoarchaeota archaeon]
MIDKRNLVIVIFFIFLMIPLSVSAKSPQTYFELREKEEKIVPVGNQDYKIKVNRIFKRQVSVVLPDGTIENFRIFDEKHYWFKDNNKLTLKLLGVKRTRNGLFARFYAKNEKIWNKKRPKVTYSIDHDATPLKLKDSIETGQIKKYTNGMFEHELEMLYADTIFIVYKFDGRQRIATTGGKRRYGASEDIIYFRPTKIQRLNGRRHRIYFELFSPDFEVKLKED